MKYSKAFTGIDTSTSLEESPCDDAVVRWRKKAIRARIIIGLLTTACCVLIVVMIVTYETRHSGSQSMDCATVKETSKRASETTVNFLHVSDLHFDPFYDKTITSGHYFCRSEGAVNGTAKYVAPFGRIGCDSPMALVDLAVDGMKNVSNREDIDFLLLTGDLSGHRMWTNYSGPERVLDNIARVSDKTHEAFSKIPVFPLIGNNDLPGHYVLPNSTSDWYKTVLSHWAPLILCSACSSEVNRPTSMEVLQETFLEGGYYNASIGDGKMVLLVLNSLYWSTAVRVTEDITHKAGLQLAWLKDQLQIAKNQGQRVILASHIPPGIDSFEMSPFWFNNYTHSYVNLVAEIYKDTVAGQFFAHIHRDDFRLQMTEPSNEDSTGSFVLLAPSISPVYENNPAFRVVSLDTDTRSLVDYTQYYMDLVMATEFSNPMWQVGYTFSEKYPSPNKLLDTDRIRQLNEQLINETSNQFWNGYISSRQTNYQPAPYSRFVLYCAMKHVFFEDFGKCVARYSVPGG